MGSDVPLEIRVGTASDRAAEFLDALVDGESRQRKGLADDPLAMLSEYGISVSVDSTALLGGLPEPDEIRRMLAALPPCWWPPKGDGSPCPPCFWYAIAALLAARASGPEREEPKSG